MTFKPVDDMPHGARVYQAQGMISAQANCSVEEALGMMVERAQAMVTTVEVIAAGVLDRTIRFG